MNLLNSEKNSEKKGTFLQKNPTFGQKRVTFDKKTQLLTILPFFSERESFFNHTYLSYFNTSKPIFYFSNSTQKHNQANLYSGPDETRKSDVVDGLDGCLYSFSKVSNIKGVVVRIMPTTTYNNHTTDIDNDTIYTTNNNNNTIPQNTPILNDTDSENKDKNTDAYQYANPINKIFRQNDFITFIKKSNYRSFIFSFLNIPIQYQGSLTKYIGLHHQNIQQHIFCLLNANIIRKVGEKDERINKYRDLYAKFNGNSPKKMRDVVEWYALTDDADEFYNQDLIKNWISENISFDIKHNVMVLGLKRLEISHKQIQQERKTKADNTQTALNILIKSKDTPDYNPRLNKWSDDLGISTDELNDMVVFKIKKQETKKYDETIKSLRKFKASDIKFYEKCLIFKAKNLGLAVDDLRKKVTEAN